MRSPPPESVLSIDFSLDCLDVGLQDAGGEWLWPHRAYANNWPGFLALKQELLATLGEQAVQLTVLGESTGLYWWHTYQQLAHDQELATFEPQLVLLNPAHVKHFRKALPERDKTDMLDVALIARYYQATGSQEPQAMDNRYGRLRFLSRAYNRLIHTLAAEKAFCQAILYLAVSEYQRRRPFSNLFGVTSQKVLEGYPDVAMLADVPLDELVNQLNDFSQGKLSDPRDNAYKLRRVAADSFPLPVEWADMVQTILQLTLQLVRFLENHKKTYRHLIEQELARFPEANLALAEPGLGSVLVAGCLSEIQDTRRFTTGSKWDHRRKRYRSRTYRDGQAAVAKLAGLWWPRRDSGRSQSEERRLSRERNPYLRFWFIQAANSLRRYRDDYAAYYARKRRQSNKHAHKRAQVLTARKAVRLVFALLHKGQRQCLEEVPDG
jgi:transposase